MDPPQFDLRCDARLLDLERLLDRPSAPQRTQVEAHLAVAGRGRHLDDLDLSGRLAASGLVAGAPLDTLLAAFAVANGSVQVDTLRLRSTVLEASGAGIVVLGDRDRDSDFRFRLATGDLAPIARLAGLDTLGVRSGRLEVAVAGRGRTPHFEISGALDGIAVDEVRVAGLDLGGRGRWDQAARRLEARATLTAQQLFRAGLEAREAKLEAGWDGATCDVALHATVDESRSLHLHGRYAAAASSKRVDLDSLVVTTATERWSLEREASLALVPGGFRIEGFALRSQAGRIAAAGGIDRFGEQDLEVEIEGLALAPLAALRGRPWVDGTLSGRALLRGPASSPAFDGQLAVELRTGATPVVRFEAEARSDPESLAVRARVAPPAGSSLVLAGTLPVALVLAPAPPGSTAGVFRRTEGEVALRLSGDDVDLGFLASFLDPKSGGALGGRLSADLRVAGSASRPECRGRLTLAGGRAALPGWGIAYDGITFAVAVEGDAVRLESARLGTAKGTLAATGAARFRGLHLASFRLDLDAQRFEAIGSRDLAAVLSGDLALAGRGDSLTLRGHLRPEAFDYYLPTASTATDVELTPEDYRMLTEHFGYGVLRREALPAAALVRQADVDLRIEARRDVWLHQRADPRFSVEVTGDIRVQKPPGEPLRLYGRVEPIPGHGFVEELGRRFDLEGGGVDLNGELSRMNIDVQATYETTPTNDPGGKEVKVTLGLRGRLDALELELESDPPLAQSEILSFIATGQVPSLGSGTRDSRDTAGNAAQIGLAGVTGAVEELASEKSGLDVVQIRQDGLRGATLVTGKYVSPRLYLGYRQPVVFEDTNGESSESSKHSQFDVEYSATRWLLLNAQGEGTSFRGFLRARHAY